MIRTVLAAFLGLLFGAAAGWLIIAINYPSAASSPPDAGFVPAYPTLANPSGPAGVAFAEFVATETRAPRINTMILTSGFGSIVGAIVGGVSVILLAIRKNAT